MLFAMLFGAVGGRAAGVTAVESITFTSVTPSVVVLGSDYAYDVRGFGWDFSDRQHYAHELTRITFGPNMSLVDGMFVGTTSTNDPKIWLLDPAIPNTVPTQNEGSVKPIDTQRYRYLTMRMCASASTSALVWWHKDRSFTSGTYGAAGSEGGHGFKPIVAGCHTYSFDLIADRLTSAGSLAWNAGPIQGINIRPATASGITIKLDYVRLSATPLSVAPTVTARWTPTNATFDLLWDTTPDGRNATLIAKGVAGSTGSYTWRTPNMYPGTYYLIARSGATQYVSAPFTINTPPQGIIMAPSYTSGPDYAATVAGNAWDMASTADVSMFANVKNAVFRDGILTATSALPYTDDPSIYLNTPAPIDSNRFRYLTYRMRLHGGQDIGRGSVARALWWTGSDVGRTVSVTKDIVVYEGWRTVSIDLRTVPLEPNSYTTWSNTDKRGLRIDPHEFPEERTFDLDYVLLTANDRASTTYTIRSHITDADRQQPTVQLFYSPTQTESNGTPITCGGMRSGSLPTKIFVPVVASPGTAGRGECVWNVASVPDGDYWVYMVVNDGLDRVVVFSDTPLEVRH